MTECASAAYLSSAHLEEAVVGSFVNFKQRAQCTTLSMPCDGGGMTIFMDIGSNAQGGEKADAGARWG